MVLVNHLWEPDLFVQSALSHFVFRSRYSYDHRGFHSCITCQWQEMRAELLKHRTHIVQTTKGPFTQCASGCDFFCRNKLKVFTRCSCGSLYFYMMLLPLLHRMGSEPILCGNDAAAAQCEWLHLLQCYPIVAAKIHSCCRIVWTDLKLVIKTKTSMDVFPLQIQQNLNQLSLKSHLI